MTTEENKAIVRRFLTEVLQNGDMSILDHIFAPNYQNRMTGQGIDSVKQIGGMMQSAISDYHVTIDNLVAEGDEVVARFTMTGTITGSVMGSKPSGKAFTVRGLTYYRLSDGKIVEDDPITNQDMMQLLGIKLPVAA
jgi:predicted ester cyclase